MERDFLGLNSKDSPTIVKEELVDLCKDQVFTGGPGVQWAFSNKVSALPHFVSLKATHEERPKKIIYDTLSSSAFQPIFPTATNAFDSNHKPGGSQKNFNLDRQGTYFMMQANPFNGVDASHRSQEIRALPVSSQPFSVAMANPSFKMHGSLGSPTVNTISGKQQHHGAIPMTNSHPAVPFMGSIPATYGPRNPLKPMQAQLTIFYAGTVNVYDDISPEKAQAIMSLAANGAVAVNAVTPTVQVPPPALKKVTTEGIHVNQSQTMSPCSGLSSQVSGTSHSGAQSVGASSTADDLMGVKSVGSLATRIQPETSKVVTPMGSAPQTLMPTAVPQARKASLARFLEKRKERVTSAAPYSCKISLENAPVSEVARADGKCRTAIASIAFPSSVERS